jgi:hypothetical protein
MLDHEVISSVAKQMSEGKTVSLEGKSFDVQKTSSERLRTVRFKVEGKDYQAIEQNSKKPSRWGQLARDGHWVVQFRDVETGKYVAVCVDGEVTEYGRQG